MPRGLCATSGLFGKNRRPELTCSSLLVLRCGGPAGMCMSCRDGHYTAPRRVAVPVRTGVNASALRAEFRELAVPGQFERKLPLGQGGPKRRPASSS